MIIINAVEGKKIHLGRIGENEARAVRFDVSRILAEFPGASISVLNMRPSDPDAYPVNGQYIALEGSYLLWTLQSGDLVEDGLGECELKATLDGAIVKSIIWTTEICPALDGNGEPPEPWESWQQQVEDDADRAEAAAEDSEAWAIGERGGEPVEDDDPAYHNNAKYWAEQAEETLAGKADKVSGATNNHFAALDATGNLKDSGHADGDYARKTDTVLTTTLSRGRDATSQVGMGSLAFGDRVKATAPYSRANGSLSEASGINAAAEGYDAKAAGQNAHAEGFHTRANNKDQHVFGAFNAPDPSTSPAGSQGRFIEIVGNGSSESNRSNARTLDWQGNERLKGDLYVGANADGTGGSKVAKVTDIPEPVDISGKADKVEGAVAGNFAGLDENGNLTDSGSKASDFLTEHQDISGKADKVTGATNGNLAGLDGSGNLTDSGKKAADFVPVTSFRADAMPMSATDPKTVEQTATELKSAIDGKADLIRDTVQNVAIASVPDAASNLPLTALRFAIEPIQSGTGDPSPSNVRPITGRTGAVVNQHGAFYTFEQGGINDSTGAYNDYTTRIRTSDFAPINGNTISVVGFETGSNVVRSFYWYDSAKTFISSVVVDAHDLPYSYSVTPPSGAAFFKLVMRTNPDGSNISPTGKSVALNPTTYHISWQTEAGTVYGGYVDWVNGQMVIDGFLYVYEGTEPFQKSGTALNGFYNNLSQGTVPHDWAYMLNYNSTGTAITNEASSMFKMTRDVNTYKTNYGYCYLDSGMNFDADPDVFGTTTTSFANKLHELYEAGTPLTVFAKLATPITVPLTGLDEIKTAQGINNIFADCGDIVLMEYGCDTKGYIDKKLAELTALILEN